MGNLNSIYLRNPDDKFYQWDENENSDGLEELIAKIKIILMSKRGDVMGDPYLGLDLDSYVFETDTNFGNIKKEFLTQLAQYAPESANHNVDCVVTMSSDITHNVLNVVVSIDGIRVVEETIG